MIPSPRTVAGVLAAAYRAFEEAGNPFAGHDVDLARTWSAVNETTGQISYFRNYHEVRCCVGHRLNHACAEGAFYLGDER